MNVRLRHARAAQRLRLSQPAVSKTLAELEALAGRRLVERGRASAQLTQAGEQFLRYAVDVTRAMESAAGALTRSGPPPAPAAAVGALPTVACGPALMRRVSFELLYAESLAIVARPGASAGRPGAAPLSPDELLDYPLVIPGAGTAPRHNAEALLQAHGAALPPGCTQTQSVSAARALTLLSDAIWITPQHAVQFDIDSGWLCGLSVPVPGGAEPVGLPRRGEANLSHLAEQLMDILRELS